MRAASSNLADRNHGGNVDALEFKDLQQATLDSIRQSSAISTTIKTDVSAVRIREQARYIGRPLDMNAIAM